MQLISRWWSESYLPPLDFYRKRHVELYFWAFLGTFEPEFRSSRIAFTKLSTSMTVIDDLYDTHGTLDEIKICTEGVRRWDTSLISRLPDHIQKNIQVFHEDIEWMDCWSGKKKARAWHGWEGSKFSVVEIRKAYRARALVCHPHKRPDDPNAAALFQKIQTAYELLTDRMGIQGV